MTNWLFWLTGAPKLWHLDGFKLLTLLFSFFGFLPELWGNPQCYDNRLFWLRGPQCYDKLAFLASRGAPNVMTNWLFWLRGDPQCYDNSAFLASRGPQCYDKLAFLASRAPQCYDKLAFLAPRGHQCYDNSAFIGFTGPPMLWQIGFWLRGDPNVMTTRLFWLQKGAPNVMTTRLFLASRGPQCYDTLTVWNFWRFCFRFLLLTRALGEKRKIMRQKFAPQCLTPRLFWLHQLLTLLFRFLLLPEPWAKNAK